MKLGPQFHITFSEFHKHISWKVHETIKIENSQMYAFKMSVYWRKKVSESSPNRFN